MSDEHHRERVRRSLCEAFDRLAEAEEKLAVLAIECGEHFQRGADLHSSPEALPAGDSARRRPDRAGADVQLRRYIDSTIAAQIGAALVQQQVAIADAIGAVIGNERRRHRAELDAFRSEIDSLRTEIAKVRGELERTRTEIRSAAAMPSSGSPLVWSNEVTAAPIRWIA